MMRHVLLAAVVLVGPAVRAEDRPKLPEGAIARLGNVDTGRGARSDLPFYAAAFLADGRLVTVASDCSLRCWDARSGKELDRLVLPKDAAFPALAASPRGVFAATPAGIQEWRPGGGWINVASTAALAAGGVALAPDASTWLAAWTYSATAYELPSSKRLFDVASPSGVIFAKAIAPGGRYVAAIVNGNPRLHIWEVVAGTPLARTGGDSEMVVYTKRMFFSPDGRSLVRLTGSGMVIIHESATGLTRRVLPLPSTAVGTHELGPATARATVPPPPPDIASAAALAPDGRYLAYGDANGSLHLCDLATGCWTNAFTGHAGAIAALAFSVDGALLASTSADTSAVVWDVAVLRTKIRTADRNPMQPDTAWRNLASKNARVADEAVWALTTLSREALSLFRERLKPLIGPDPTMLRRWVTELDDSKFAVREKAEQNLAAQRTAARTVLAAGLTPTSSAEVRARITRLLAKLEDGLPAETLRILRALEVLEKIGGADARAIVDTLAKSTDDDVRREIESMRRRWK